MKGYWSTWCYQYTGILVAILMVAIILKKDSDNNGSLIKENCYYTIYLL